MFISVIIPTCNRNKELSKCLDGLLPKIQTLIQNDYEVIVTDDSKNSEAKDLIELNYHWVNWIKGPEKGPAANRNNGAKNAKGKWFIFLDDDVIPGSKLIVEYINGINRNLESLAFEGAIYPDDENLLKRDMAECPVNTTGGHFWSANICVNAQLFKEVGGFDETYLIAAQEDQQLKLDIECATKKNIIFLKNCIVIHPVRYSSIKKQLTNLTIVSKNYAWFAAKNRSLLGYDNVPIFLLLQVKDQLKNTLKFIKKRKIKKSFISIIYCITTIPLNVYNFYIFSRNLNDKKPAND